MKQPFKIGEKVVSVRDVEMSDLASVIGYEENERGFVFVAFADGVTRPLPAQSLQRPVDKKESHRPIGGPIWAESTSMGDYMRRMAEADAIPKKEKAK